MQNQFVDNLRAQRGLRVMFQPIIELRRDRTTLVAVECLTRGPAGTRFESPVALFDYAREMSIEPGLDRLCVATALREAGKLPRNIRISVNVHASTLSEDASFPALLLTKCNAAGIDPKRVAIEIVESTAPHDPVAFAQALSELRALGMRIALDDVGLGYSNYKMIVDTHAEYFKIDRYLVCGVENDPHRRAVLDSVVMLAKRVGARVVAEGVETAATLNAVLDAGVDLVQGNLFSRPCTLEDLQIEGWIYGRTQLGLQCVASA